MLGLPTLFWWIIILLIGAGHLLSVIVYVCLRLWFRTVICALASLSMFWLLFQADSLNQQRSLEFWLLVSAIVPLILAPLPNKELRQLEEDAKEMGMNDV